MMEMGFEPSQVPNTSLQRRLYYTNPFVMLVSMYMRTQWATVRVST
jgi:hypothetical protein